MGDRVQRTEDWVRDVRQGTEDGRQGTETKTGVSGRVARNRDVRLVQEDGRKEQ
jgi:hypothetical protein